MQGSFVPFLWLLKLAEWPQNHGPTDTAFVEKEVNGGKLCLVDGDAIIIYQSN